jgi:hypothetical protein
MARLRISPVPLQPLLPLFHRLNREHFSGVLVCAGQPLTAVRWSDGRMSRTAGYYRRGPGVGEGRGSEIVLSRPVLEPLPQEATESTLCHEMIHAWVDLVQASPRKPWPLVSGSNGSDQCCAEPLSGERASQLPDPGPASAVDGGLSSCKRRTPCRRRTRHAACRSCCNQHHGGRWHPSCLLHYEPVE